jgi:hypothetical protein
VVTGQAPGTVGATVRGCFSAGAAIVLETSAFGRTRPFDPECENWEMPRTVMTGRNRPTRTLQFVLNVLKLSLLM